MSIRILCSVAGFALVARPAAAEPFGSDFELGVLAGGHAFSKDLELGVPDEPSQPVPSSNGMVGVRAAVPVTSSFAVEGEVNVIPTTDTMHGDRLTVLGLGVHARVDLLRGSVRPFVVAGVGTHVLISSSPQLQNDADRALHWGPGVRFALNDRVDLRVDARQLIVPDRTKNGATSDYEVSFGATYRFGGERRVVVTQIVREPAPPPPVAEPPPAPAPPPPAPASPPPAPAQKSAPISELAGIGFELDSARIDAASQPILTRAYQLLRDHPELEVEISGHTSSDGDAERNLALSLTRAEAVKAYLVHRGIDGNRILTVGHGADLPVADNTREEGRRQNRRIEFRILRVHDDELR
jgi:OOP family OmpA-OmpF porin